MFVCLLLAVVASIGFSSVLVENFRPYMKSAVRGLFGHEQAEIGRLPAHSVNKDLSAGAMRDFANEIMIEEERYLRAERMRLENELQAIKTSGALPERINKLRAEVDELRRQIEKAK